MHITTLTSGDSHDYRELMLEAYEQAPDAFTTTAAERRAEPESWWVKRIGSLDGLTTSFGAWDGGDLVGTVALEYSAKPKTRHSALVLGMYVKPGQRGRGVGLELMKVAVSAASSRPELSTLTLTLTEGNEPALRLYTSIGFSIWGVQPNAIRTASGLKGKVHMSMAVNCSRTAA